MLAEPVGLDNRQMQDGVRNLSPAFASAFWLGLIIVAGLASLLSGLDYRIVALAMTMSAAPALIDLVTGRSDGQSDISDIWVVFAWLGLSFVAVLTSGAAASPLAILFAMGPLHALSVGRYRLGIEASVFAAIGYLSIAALDVLGLANFPAGWLGALSGLGVLISVLQIGVFIAATRAAIQNRVADREALKVWEETLSGVPVLILKLDTAGRVVSWIGNIALMASQRKTDLTRFLISDLFNNAEIIHSSGGEPFRVLPKGEEPPELEARLVPVTGGYRMVLSPLSNAMMEADRLRGDLVESETAYRDQARWVASLGHELRNMLNPVGGYSDLILAERAGPVGDTYKDFARSIKQGAEHLGMLVDDLMTATKSHSGHLSLYPETLDLRLEIEDAIKMVTWQSDAQKVSVLLIDGADVMALADRKALRQILINLFSNAIKYSTAGGRVTASVSSGDEGVRLEVRDQGEGMSKADLERIGEAFFQGENSKGRAGSGLGLTIVMLLSKAMGGRVDLESEPGKGTLARIHLPKAEDVSEDTRSVSPKAAEAS